MKDEEEEINFMKNSGQFRNRTSRSKRGNRYGSRSFYKRESERSPNKSSRWEWGRSCERNLSCDRNFRRNSGHEGRSYSRGRCESQGRYRGQSRGYETVNHIYKENGEEEEKAATNNNLEKMIIDCATTKSVTGKQWMVSICPTYQKKKERS